MVRKLHARKARYLITGVERNRKPRMKTFLKEEDAKKHAESLKLKKYKIVKSRFGLSKKFKIVLE